MAITRTDAHGSHHAGPPKSAGATSFRNRVVEILQAYHRPACVDAAQSSTHRGQYLRNRLIERGATGLSWEEIKELRELLEPEMLGAMLQKGDEFRSEGGGERYRKLMEIFGQAGATTDAATRHDIFRKLLTSDKLPISLVFASLPKNQ